MNATNTINRSEWIDSAKGIAVSLVVVYHVVNGLRGAFNLNGTIFDYYILLSPVITPLFFLVGGFFAAKSLEMDWKTFIDKRFLHFMYFYVLWTIISVSMRYFMSDVTTNKIGLFEIITSIYKPVYTMWFLYAFAISFVLAKILKNIHHAYVIAFATAVQAFCLPIYAEEWKLPLNIGWFFVFFIIGIYASSWIRETVLKMTPKHALGCAAIALVTAIIGYNTAEVRVPPIYLTIATFSAFAIMGTCNCLSGTRTGQILAYAGERSFAIYLMHFAPVAGFRIILIKSGITNNPYVIAPIATVLSIITCIVLYDILMKARITFLFERPSFLSLSALNAREKAQTAT